MDLAVGDKILVEFSTYGDRFLSIVADVKDDGRLLVYSPMTDPVIQRLKIDKKAKVLYAHDGRFMGFSTRILNDVEAPDTILELAKPNDCYDAEDRFEPRCSCRFPATVVEGDRAAQAVIEDMSASCSRIRFLNGGLVPFVEDVDREVKLTFHPFDVNDDGYSVGCLVKNAFMKDGKRYAVLEFNRDEKDARKRISNFIEAQVCCGIPRL